MTKISKDEYAELLLNMPAEFVGYTLFNDLVSLLNMLQGDLFIVTDDFKSKFEDEQVLSSLNLVKQHADNLYEIIYGYHDYLYKPDNQKE